MWKNSLYGPYFTRSKISYIFVPFLSIKLSPAGLLFLLIMLTKEISGLKNMSS